MLVHINQELVTRIRYGGKVFHTGEHLNGISLGKGNFAKKKDYGHLLEIPLRLRAVHLQVAAQHVHTCVMNSPGTSTAM